MLQLYKNIKFYRKQNGMTQDDLAKRAGYTDRSSIAKIEKGLVDLSQSKIAQFAEIFGITDGDLMGWDHKETPEELADIAAKVLTNDKAKHMVELYFELNDSEQDLVMNLMETLKNKKTDDVVSQVGIVSSREKV